MKNEKDKININDNDKKNFISPSSNKSSKSEEQLYDPMLDF